MSEVKSIAKSDIVDITTLQLWDKNPRSINKDRFAELKTRLSRQGQIKPLLVTKDGVVIGGNMRLRALTELGVTKVWVSVTEAVTDKEIFDLALTDNEEFGYYEQEQVAELALSLGLTPLELKSYSLSLGAPTTLDLVLDKFGPEPEEDEAPEVDEENTYSIEGEVYQLGPHRVMCGSSTSLDDFEKLMDGAKADMVFTDPPYEFETQGGGVLKNSKQMNEVKTNGVDKFDPFSLTPNAKTHVFFHNKALVGKYAQLAENWGMAYDLAIYKKPGLPNWAGHLMTDIEYIAIIGALDPNKGYDMAMYSKVYEGKKDQDNELSYSKPVALCQKFIKLYSNNTVLDLFGGSGSTLIACEQTNRMCYMMELDPKYVDVIRKRYAKHVGEEEAWQEATPAVIQ